MKTINLNQSPVVFSENPHGYHLGDRQLSGITSLIKHVLGLGYKDDDIDGRKGFFIKRAGEYGKSVHHAIEAYDTLGIRVTLHPKSERYRTYLNDDVWDVADELDSYIKHREGYEPIANEYTVSDEERYASNIDNVWLKTDTEGIWLVDTKTNNLDLYPGGTDALKEYLSWQLSIYAYLFERQNPELTVEGLACNWLRHGDAAFWEIERKPDDYVKNLLYVPWEYDHNTGKVAYIFDDELVERLTGSPVNAVAPVSNQIVSQQIVQAIYDFEKQAKAIKEKQDELKKALREAMANACIKSWDSGLFKATIGADSVTRTFDTARFKNDYPELYEQYVKETIKKGSFTIKLRQ